MEIQNLNDIMPYINGLTEVSDKDWSKFIRRQKELNNVLKLPPLL